MNVLGIIPARGGSKGVPDKNIRKVGGTPLLEWAIKGACESNLTHFVVSSDSDKILNLAAQNSCETVRRPDKLAQDKTPMLPVLQNAVEIMEKRHSIQYDYCVILQPTTPFRTGRHIDESIEMLGKNDCDSVVSVYKVDDHHPARMYTLKNGLLEKFAPEIADVRRQELPAVFHRNGLIYTFKRDLLKKDTFLGDKIKPYVMGLEVSVNIDNEMDLAFADFLISSRQ
ncbi:cytidylyltransferase domain-containing protein [Maridesulfovibrio bastinii]|uniref:acylneuraminate cytidylyltransferase family protein n=1 Tax=Maridesulfovibrio bastinii TaxID=47157 RepID=UPI000409D86C|nr:acylneuraminate cytidylyltransferase family protein [Maridesulfovibrio bastinii]